MTVDTDHDGINDHTFKLQTTDAAVQHERFFADAQLTFIGDRLHLVSIDSPDTLTLAVGPARPGDHADMASIHGTGLAHLRSATTVEPSFTDDPGTGGGSSGGCSAGGPGSTSCSISDPLVSCSITCSTGYYACCTGATCKCKKAV